MEPPTHYVRFLKTQETKFNNRLIRTTRALRCFRAALDLLQVYGFKALRNTQARRVPGYESKSVPVTVVSCTLGTESRYLATLRSWLSNNPSEVVIVTIDSARDRVTELISRITTHKIHVLSTPEPNFRQQMVLGIRKVKTELLVFADDRTFWGPSTLRSMTDALSDREVGGVMTMQRVIPTATTSLELTSWESFGALNLVRRNINHSFLAYFNNGQVLNLSGRTVAYRTEILQNESLLNAFLHDYWRGKHLIRTGDDNFLTTWTLHHGWKTHFVTNPHASISCSVCPDAAYIRQLLRWSRDTARAYIMDLVWAVKFGGRAHVLRCMLNILCNYMSDFAVLAEIGNLLLTSAVTAGLRGDEDSTQW